MLKDPVTGLGWRMSSQPAWPEVDWKPWKKKFAWKKTEVNSKTIRFKFYYERAGVIESTHSPISAIIYETATDLFDVLKKS